MANSFGLKSSPLVGASGSCIVCMQGTDTGLSFHGEPDWCTAGLVALGVPVDEAIATFEQGGASGDSATLTVTYRVCASCVSDTTLPAPGLIHHESVVPCLTQPGVRA